MGDTLSNYFHRYKYYLELIAYLKIYLSNLDDPYELDMFIIVANHCFKFRRRSDEERHPKYNNSRQKYYRVHIMITLTPFEDDILK